MNNKKIMNEILNKVNTIVDSQESMTNTIKEVLDSIEELKLNQKEIYESIDAQAKELQEITKKLEAINNYQKTEEQIKADREEYLNKQADFFLNIKEVEKLEAKLSKNEELMVKAQEEQEKIDEIVLELNDLKDELDYKKIARESNPSLVSQSEIDRLQKRVTIKEELLNTKESLHKKTVKKIISDENILEIENKIRELNDNLNVSKKEVEESKEKYKDNIDYEQKARDVLRSSELERNLIKDYYKHQEIINERNRLEKEKTDLERGLEESINNPFGINEVQQPEPQQVQQPEPQQVQQPEPQQMQQPEPQQMQQPEPQLESNTLHNVSDNHSLFNNIDDYDEEFQRMIKEGRVDQIEKEQPIDLGNLEGARLFKDIDKHDEEFQRMIKEGRVDQIEKEQPIGLGNLEGARLFKDIDKYDYEFQRMVREGKAEPVVNTEISDDIIELLTAELESLAKKKNVVVKVVTAPIALVAKAKDVLNRKRIVNFVKRVGLSIKAGAQAANNAFGETQTELEGTNRTR